ncbi:c-type cytochrome [Comamonas humi]
MRVFETPLKGLLGMVLLAACAAMAQPAPGAVDMAARVQACTACHGKEGRSTPDGYFPRIAGKPAQYLYNQLLNFRDGRRHYPAMSHLLQWMSDDYLREIARHFAALDLPYAPPPQVAATPQVIAQGRELALRGDAARNLPACVQCHGEQLTGNAFGVAGLVGLPRDYLNSQLGAWQNGQRHAQAPDCMAQVVERMTASDIVAVTAWLASQPVPAGARPATEAPRGTIACAGWPDGAKEQP